MVYLQVSHVDDNDCDLFRFSNLNDAIDYITKEEIEEWIMSDMPLGPFTEDDYDFIRS